MAVHESYVCHCSVPTPLKKWGEDTGLCEACNLVHDENLYEMRLRQHLPNWTYDSVSDYLAARDPQYAALVRDL